MFRAERRELFAEFLGTFVLMAFGLGVNAQVTVGQNNFGDFFSVNVGWGIAVVLGVYVSGGISGGHLNPAVSLAMAVRRRLAWSKLLPYVLAQFAGAFVASAMIYLVYQEAIIAVEATSSVSSVLDQSVRHSMSTAGIFGTYPNELADGSRLSSIPGGLIDQIVGTGMLLLCVFALIDSKNLAPKSNMGPLLVGSIVLMIGLAFGSNCGYAINPARDFAPRLFTFFAGWGDQVFKTPDAIWWLVPIIGPCIGGVLGAFLYDICITRLHPEETADSPTDEE